MIIGLTICRSGLSQQPVGWDAGCCVCEAGCPGGSGKRSPLAAPSRHARPRFRESRAGSGYGWPGAGVRERTPTWLLWWHRSEDVREQGIAEDEPKESDHDTVEDQRDDGSFENQSLDPCQTDRG